ncbi:S66 peptidase family protein [Pseudonocardia humida]|uniref:LD-carboxypeptidase n=1 Tax=Pseudonocardia humida TaxID=2800819 RepID=A0ABT1AB19_9PSEU|nr:LD-carboxypeptidase [Pseudonocardia humida]MCO1660219.1 LD-carboxypeptidase [Pseudonocardia humida]
MSGSLSVGPGDAVALVSPASASPPEAIARAHRLLRSWGLHVVREAHGPGNGAPARPLSYLAAPDADRLAEFQAAWDDPDVRAVVCLRGGYGTQRIVDGIDWDRGRKLLVGFSDITALHLALWTATGLPSLHGPAVGGRAAGPTAAAAESLRRAMASFGTSATVRAVPTEPTFALRNGTGTVQGVLLGGNLAVLATSLVEPRSWTGTVLLLEDVDEPPYRVDRWLTFLGRSGVLGQVSGVALGRFNGSAYSGETTRRVLAVLDDRLRHFGVPFVGGFPVGHGPGAVTVPLGQPATLDLDRGALRLAGGSG